MMTYSKMLLKFTKILVLTKIAIIYLVARCIVAFIPLKKNKYFCIAMTGNSYGDSIKCMSDYIDSHETNANIVWAFTDVFYEKNNCEHKKVKLYTFPYYYHILTSKYVLTNVSLDKKLLIKRHGQVCVQTWHGTALKRIGVDMYINRPDLVKRFTRYNASITDILVSGSRFMTEIFYEKCLYPREIIKEIGTPRNDIFFSERKSIVKRIYDYYDIDLTKKIILYAPTFRADGSMIYYDVDLRKIAQVFEAKSRENYVIMVRLHPNLIKNEEKFSSLFDNDIIDASLYPDMIDLLYSADILVTDYSSCMFDFMYSYRPIILYVPDRLSYDRGYYLDINKLPFIIVNDNSEITKKCSAYCEEEYKGKINKFLHEIGSAETGNATAKLFELMKNVKE